MTIFRSDSLVCRQQSSDTEQSLHGTLEPAVAQPGVQCIQHQVCYSNTHSTR